MTRDEIIELGREAGGTAYVNRGYPGETAIAFGPKALERLAELITARHEQRIQDLEDLIAELQERDE